MKFITFKENHVITLLLENCFKTCFTVYICIAGSDSALSSILACLVLIGVCE